MVLNGIIKTTYNEEECLLNTFCAHIKLNEAAFTKNFKIDKYHINMWSESMPFGSKEVFFFRILKLGT